MYLLISIPLFQFIPFRQFSYLLPWPVRSPACRRVFYPPWGKIHPRCPTVASRVRRRNTSDDTPTPALSLPLAMVPILGRSPRISSQNACHTNNIQHFHITFTRKRQDSTRLLIIDTRRFSFFFFSFPWTLYDKISNDRWCLLEEIVLAKDMAVSSEAFVR